MLISEIRGWYYVITWDNPSPPDSSAILKALENLGKLTQTQTKTTVILAPRKKVRWQDVRVAIKQNLDSKIGNAAYVNLRSGNVFQVGSKTKWRWRKLP